MPGQSLAEYSLAGGLVALMGIAALMGVNNGMLQSLTGVKNALGGASGSAAGQTNQAIAFALLQSAAPAPSGPSVGGGLTSTSQANILASINAAQALISQVDPTNLPDVSGSTSDIATLASTAASLVQLANQLDILALDMPGLDVSELVYKARRLATAQYALAGELMTGYGLNIYNQKAMDLGNSLLAQYPADSTIQLIVNQSADGGNTGNPSNFGSRSMEMLNDYKAVFDPVAQIIQTQALQTQQAMTVIANGGNINNQNPVKTSGDNTLADANAINLCQDANCTVSGQ